MDLGTLLIQVGANLAPLTRDLKTMETQLTAVPNRLKSSLGTVNIAPNLTAGLGELKKQTEAVTGSVRQMAAAETQAAAVTKIGAANYLDWTAVVKTADGAAKQAVASEQALAAAVARTGEVARIGAANWLDWSAVQRTAGAAAAQSVATQRSLATATTQTAQATAATGRTMLSIAQQQAYQDQAMRRSIGVTDQVIARQRALAAAQTTTARSGQVAATQIAATFTTVATASRGSGVSVNSLRGPLVSLTSQLVGTNPALSTFTSLLGSLAFGSVAVSGALAGLGLLAGAYRLLTRDAREAAQVQREALDRVKELARVQALGIGGQSAADLKQAQDKLNDLNVLIAAARLRLTDPATALSQAAAGVQPVDAQAELNSLLKQQFALQRELEGAQQAGLQATVNQTLEMTRAANQSVALAGLEGDAQRRLAVEFDAANKLFSARNTLTGRSLELMTGAIEFEKQRSLRALDVEASARRTREELEKQVQALKDLDERLKGIAFPKLAIPQGPSGLNLTPRVVPPSPFTAGATAIDTSGLDDTIQAVQQVTSGFKEMADALGDTSKELSAALRAVDAFASGIQQIKAGQAAGGTAGALGQVSGVLAIGAAIFGVVTAIKDGAAAAREAKREFARSMDDWVRTIRGGGDAIERAFLDARANFERVTGLNVPGSNAAEFTAAVTENMKRLQEQVEKLGGHVKPEFLKQLTDALVLFNIQIVIAIANFRAFAQTLEGARAERELGNKLRGTELDPSQEISGLLNDLKNTFPILFAKIFDGIDLSNMDAVRQAGVRFFDSIKGLSGPALQSALAGAPLDETLSWLSLFGDSLNAASKAAQDVATNLRGVPEIFNFTLESIRAAGTREFIPQGGSAAAHLPAPSQSVQQGDTVTVAPGAVVITISSDGDLFEKAMARTEAAIREGFRSAGLAINDATLKQIMKGIKSQAVATAESRGQDSKDWARAMPV